jgi:restriction system-associated AAA family ATPase
MKLLRLKIHEPFRSLQAGFELLFLREWDHFEGKDSESPYVLAGPNGSGKSNVLEVLAAIFYHLECQYLDYRPESFAFNEDDNPDGFQEELAVPNGFELEYLISLPAELQSKEHEQTAHIRIVKSVEEKSGAQLFWLNNEEYGEEKRLPRSIGKAMLPEQVLGYSSGENEILSLPFFKMRFIQLDEYLDSLRLGLPYPGKSESSHTYLDTGFSQAILLCNLLFEDSDTLQPFRQEVGIEALCQFRIILKKRIEVKPEEADRYPRDVLIVEEDEVENEHYFIPILQKFEAGSESSKNFDPVINRLQRCSTSQFHDTDTNILYLDFWVNEDTKTAFKNNFASAIDLFESFQILLTLNLYSVSEQLKKDLYNSNSLYVTETVPTLPSDERIMRFKDLVLKKKGVDSTFYAKGLSDGEHQFLHSLGLCLLYRNTNSLFLLDEPETHFNPEWRSQLISRLRECFAHSNQNQREILITTHTPFLISDSRQEKVLVFKKDDDNGEVSVKRPKFNTLGASVNKITKTVFNKRESIGGYAQQLLDGLQKRFESGEDPDQIIEEISADLGDSVEKILLLKTIQDHLDKVEE